MNFITKYKNNILLVLFTIVLCAGVLLRFEYLDQKERKASTVVETWDVKCVNGMWLPKPVRYAFRTDMVQQRLNNEDGTFLLRLNGGTEIIVQEVKQ